MDIEVAEIVYDVDGVRMVGLRTPRLMRHRWDLVIKESASGF